MPSAASSRTSSAEAIVPLKTTMGSLAPRSIARTARTSSTPAECPSRRSNTSRSTASSALRTRVSSSLTVATGTAVCPAAASADANRSRTNAVSSATTTVLDAGTMDAAAVTLEVSAGAVRTGSLYCRSLQVLVIIRSPLRHRDRPLVPGSRARRARLAAGACMATCPECDADMEVDEFDVDKGDLISCPECGSNLEVTSLSPLELEAVDDDEEDDDDDEDDLDEEEEGDDFDDEGDEDDDEKEDWDE